MEIQLIQNRIYEIRGSRIMLDFDLARMYQVETKRLKEQVRRNIERFPEDFMFQISKEEWEFLRSQIATSNRGGHRYSPFAFTQEGVAMLSGVLKSPIAISVNINIMRAFVVTRNLLLSIPTDRTSELEKGLKELKQYIEEVFADYNDINEDTRIQLELINETLAEMQSKNQKESKPRPRIGYI